MALTSSAAVSAHRHPSGIDDDPAFFRLMAAHGRQHGKGNIFDRADADIRHDRSKNTYTPQRTSVTPSKARADSTVEVDPTLTTGRQHEVFRPRARSRHAPAPPSAPRPRDRRVRMNSGMGQHAEKRGATGVKNATDLDGTLILGPPHLSGVRQCRLRSELRKDDDATAPRRRLAQPRPRRPEF
jgi:hypothetical protein